MDRIFAGLTLMVIGLIEEVIYFIFGNAFLESLKPIAKGVAQQGLNSLNLAFQLAGVVPIGFGILLLILPYLKGRNSSSLGV